MGADRAVCADGPRGHADARPIGPVGLVDAEFPEDEYDMEAGQLVRRMMREARGPKDVERIASEVFEDCFGPGYGDGFAEFALEVWKRFEEERRDS